MDKIKKEDKAGMKINEICGINYWLTQQVEIHKYINYSCILIQATHTIKHLISIIIQLLIK